MEEIKPGFSIVIPVYNGEKHILAAIESCLQQTVLPNEIIVIDDGSTDNTESVINNIESGIIVYKKNRQNHGPSFSRNLGLQLANYSWVLFLDADDIFHKQKIEIIQFYIQQHKQIKAIGHSFQIPGETLYGPDEFWKTKIQPVTLSTWQILISSKIVTPALAVAASNRIFFNENMRYAEDHDFILRTTEAYGTWYIHMPLCMLGRKPLTEGGITGNRWNMRRGEMRMYIDYCKRKKIVLAIPFFILLSLVKHLKNALFYRTN